MIAILGLALALPAAQGASAQAAGPLPPQAPPPTLQLAAATENEFDGKWTGTFVGDSSCNEWNIPIEATIKDGEFSAVVKDIGSNSGRLNLSGLQNKLEGSVSDGGRLSFWDRFDLNYNSKGVDSFPIKISGKFTNDEFQGDFNIGSLRAYDCNGVIKLIRLGTGGNRLQWAGSTPALKAPPKQTPKATPPTIQLAAAPKNKFDGK